MTDKLIAAAYLAAAEALEYLDRHHQLDPLAYEHTAALLAAIAAHLDLRRRLPKVHDVTSAADRDAIAAEYAKTLKVIREQTVAAAIEDLQP